MSVIMGSARIDERGKVSGGQAGDQKQTSAPDYKGEVSLQTFYVHKKGWLILRPKDNSHAERIADNMLIACNNPNLGYDQGNRLGVVKAGINTASPTECDCSSLVRECVKEATGKDPGNFTTLNEVDVLTATGLFEPVRVYTSGSTMYVGDVIVTKTKGHTGIIVSGAARKGTTDQAPGRDITTVAREVIRGKWGRGSDRKTLLTAAGYDFAKVQAEVNRLLGAKTDEDIAREVIAGKWGSGDERKQRLKAAGYDPDAVQGIVNRLLKG